MTTANASAMMPTAISILKAEFRPQFAFWYSEPNSHRRQDLCKRKFEPVFHCKGSFRGDLWPVLPRLSTEPQPHLVGLEAVASRLFQSVTDAYQSALGNWQKFLPVQGGCQFAVAGRASSTGRNACATDSKIHNRQTTTGPVSSSRVSSDARSAGQIVQTPGAGGEIPFFRSLLEDKEREPEILTPLISAVAAPRAYSISPDSGLEAVA